MLTAIGALRQRCRSRRCTEDGWSSASAGRAVLSASLRLNRNVSVDSLQPELMLLEEKTLLATHKPTHLLIGLGLEQSSKAINLLSLYLKSNTPLIIDADGLNLIASNSPLELILQKWQNETLITLQPTEAEEIQH